MRQIARREDIRDLILDGVDVLLARYGYKKMTMEDLAQQVGIGKGTIYLHFPSKEELTLAHIDRIAERLLQQLKLIAGMPDPPEEKIRKMLATRVLFRFDSVSHYSQNLNDLLSSLRKDLLTRREQHFEKEAEALAAVLEEGKKTGKFGHRNSLITAQVLAWCTNSLLPFSLSPRELGKREEMEKRVSEIAELLLTGLIKRAGTTPTLRRHL